MTRDVDLNDVAFGLLELASEQVHGLVEFSAQWPRDLMRQALADLNRHGLIVLGRYRDLHRAQSSGSVATDASGALATETVWEPSLASWRSGDYLAMVATPEGVQEYERLYKQRHAPD